MVSFLFFFRCKVTALFQNNVILPMENVYMGYIL